MPRLWPKRKPRTYYIGGGLDLHGRPVTDDQPRPDPARWFGVGIATMAAIGLVVLASWAIIVFAGPTQRERDRSNIAQLQQEVVVLRHRVDALEAKR